MITKELKSTLEICKTIRKDPVLALLIPSWACRTVPVPVVKQGIPCLLLFFYEARGEAGKPKSIYPPRLLVLIDKASGKVLQTIASPLFWQSHHKKCQPIGKYPGVGIQELTVAQTEELYEAYYALCDQLLIEMTACQMSQYPTFNAWKEAFDRVKEDGIDEFINPFIAKEMPAIPSTATAVTDEGYAARHELKTKISAKEVPPQPAITNLSIYLQAARELLTNAHFEELLPLWRQIATHYENPHFSVAVVGEFSRGKTTLVNRLIEQDILPVGDLPTTAMLTRIEYGIPSSCCHIMPDTTQRQFDLLKDLLVQYNTNENGKDPEGVLWIKIANPWLAENKLQLFDTPGAGDLTGRRASITVEAIARCDSSIVTINATMPCSFSEVIFLNDHILAKRIPHVAAVISKLDLVSPSERKNVIAYVAAKLHDISTDIELWTTHSRDEISEVSDKLVLAAGPSEIRQRISLWASDANLCYLRNLQTLAQLQELVQNIYATITKQLKVAYETKAERLKSIQDSKEFVARAGMNWEDLKIAFDSKAIETSGWLSSSIRDNGSKFASDLEQSLLKSTNPKSWWEQDFPHLLRRSSESLARSLDDQLGQRLGKDRAWIEKEVRDRFEINGFGCTECKQNTTGDIPCLPETQHLDDIERMRTRYRIGSLAGTALSCWLFGPFAIGITGALGVWTDLTMKKKIENQKTQSKDTVRIVLDQVFTELCMRVQKQIMSWYNAMLVNISQQASKWQVAQLKAIESTIELAPDESNRLAALHNNSQQLLEKLNAELKEWS